MLDGVGAQLVSQVDLKFTGFQLHRWPSSHSLQASGARAPQKSNCVVDVSCSMWRGASIPFRQFGLRCSDPSSAAIFFHCSADLAQLSAPYFRLLLFSCCHTHHLGPSAVWQCFSPFTSGSPQETADSFVSRFVFWHHNLMNVYYLSGLRSILRLVFI